MVVHEIAPIFDKNSKVLILGTMPSPKSRQAAFYYMHPQNRFWRVLGAILEEDFSVSNEQKRNILLKRRIALWDVLKSCDIDGASDASIKNEVPNDLNIIFSSSKSIKYLRLAELLKNSIKSILEKNVSPCIRLLLRIAQ